MRSVPVTCTMMPLSELAVRPPVTKEVRHCYWVLASIPPVLVHHGSRLALRAVTAPLPA